MHSREPSLPPNEPRRFDIELPFPPRRMFPVHAHGGIEGAWWTIDLIAVPMESVRKTFTFQRRRINPITRRNLQIWVNHLGPSLYNPVVWRMLAPISDSMMKRLEHKPHVRKIGFYMRQIDGTHRLRALEALDFNFIYVHLRIGDVQTSKELRLQTVKNLRNPTGSQYRTKRKKRCKKCGKLIKWKELSSTEIFYKCQKCGQKVVNLKIYPEPI